MSFLDDQIAKSKDLLGRTHVRKPQLSDITDAIKHDRFDAMDWRILRNDVPVLGKNIDELATSHDYVESFFEDFFNILHQGDPTLRDKNVVDERFHPNVDMAESFLDMAEVKSLRVSTMHDLYSTAFGMASMQTTLRDNYERSREAREEQEKAMEERQKLQEMLDQLAEAMADAANIDPDDADAQQAAGEALQAMMDAIQDQAGITQGATIAAAQASAQAAQAAGMTMRQAVKQADEELQAEKALFKAFGVEDGDLAKMDYVTRARLAEQLKNNRLAEFAKVLGQFRNIQAGEVRRRITHAPDEVVGVELGDNLTRITAGEMLNLAEPELEDDFWRRWAEKNLVQLKLEGKEKMGKGPIIVICDESGSMGGGQYGGIDLENATPEAWSKAIALALCDRARRDGRDFHYIGFSSTSQQWHLEFPDGKAPIDKVIEFTEHFFRGGTHYEKPLRMGMEIIQRYEDEGKPKPDIVFITDDIFRGLTEEFFTDWEACKAKTSLRCFGILIGSSHTDSELARICDNLRSITDMSMSNPDTTRDIFRTI